MRVGAMSNAAGDGAVIGAARRVSAGVAARASARRVSAGVREPACIASSPNGTGVGVRLLFNYIKQLADK